MFNYSLETGLHCHFHRDFSQFATFTPIFVALNIASSITATLGNALILIALQKESSLNPPSKLFLRCMVFSDLGVGLLVQPATVASLLTALNQGWNLCVISDSIWNFVSIFSSAFSLATMTAISVDRHLALLLRIRYRQVVTIKRARVVATLLLLISIAVCIAVFAGFYTFIILNTIMWSSWLIISTYCYTRIYLTLKNHIQAQITPQCQPKGISALQLLRYRKTVSTTLWLFATMIICYLPLGLVWIVHAADSASVSLMIMSYFATTLLYLNSTLNPLLYCWKMREIRVAVKGILRNLLLNLSCVRIEPTK